MLSVIPLTATDLEPVYSWIEGDPLFAKYRLKRSTLAPPLERATTDPDSAVIGAYSPAGSLLGFAWFQKNGAFGRSGYLRLIAVDPASKGEGVGRALLESLEANFLKPNGILLLTTDSNQAGQAFYARMGYRKVGEIPDYVVPGLNEWIFYKN